MAAPRSTCLVTWIASGLLAGLMLPCVAFAQAGGKGPTAVLAACKAAPEASTRYVGSVSARIRAKPRAESTVLATLPIATQLRVDCVAGGWARALSEGDVQVYGWIRADTLQPQRPDLDALIAQHARARPAERKSLAERAVALAPFDPRSHQLLIDTLNARKDRKGAQQAAARRDRMISPQGEQLPREPWTLFAVEDGMVSAVALVDLAAGGNAAAPVATFRDASTWTPKGTRRETSPFLLPWRGLHFYRRGGADGVVQVLQAPSAEAIGLFAPVRHPPASAREPSLNGLASNRVVTQVGAPPVAAPSRGERALLDRALRKALKREKVPGRAISALLAAEPDDERGGVQHHVLAASGKPILLVTANWLLAAPTADAEPPLLDAVLVLEADGRGTYRVRHQLVQTTQGDAIAHHEFIDQLDLEQDGIPELFFRVGHYEGHEYEIWRNVDGVWQVVFAGAYTGV